MSHNIDVPQQEGLNNLVYKVEMCFVLTYTLVIPDDPVQIWQHYHCSLPAGNYMAHRNMKCTGNIQNKRTAYEYYSEQIWYSLNKIWYSSPFQQDEQYRTAYHIL